jgi:Skp family chaperone for outer membrane proteins
MTSKFLRILLAAAVTFTISALAQTGSAATPSSPAATSAASTPAPTINAGTKVGAINMEAAIFGSNEGTRDLEAVQKKFEPKRNELKNQSDELEALKKQLTNTQDKLNEDAAAALKKQIESKQKLYERAVQDAQEDYGNQNQEIFSRLLPKVAPVIIKYSQDNGFGMIIDTSKQWPQGPVLMAGEALDITKAVVDIYNTQSGVAAPTPGATKPAAPKSGTGAGAAKPAAPKPAEPPKQ